MIKVHATGAIRNTNGVWETIVDDAHEAYNITSVTSTSNKVTVFYPPVPKVVGSAVNTDETYTRYGIVAGQSVGLDHTDIQFHKVGDPAVFADPAALGYAYSNVWFTLYCTDACTSCLK